MSTKKKATTKSKTKPKNENASEPADDLGLKGVGVEIPRIKELDEAAAAYQKIKKARCNMTPKEIAAKEVVIGLIHKHGTDLPKDEHGTITYRNDDLVITMKHGKDSLKVKDATDEDDDSADQ